MHGDEHKFSIIDNLAQNYDWEHFTEIQVAQGAKADPLLVTVVMAKNEIMELIVAENGIQTIVGNGLFLIDQQGGCYDEGVAKNGIMEPPVGENGMQTIVGKGLFCIDQQGGFYDEGDC
jgi:hypothetical protein